VAPRVRRCIIPERQTTVIINNTRIVNSLTIENSVVVNRGPDPRLIERASGRPIRETRIEQVRGVAPEPHVDRAKLRVDPQRMREGLRVAEPTRREHRQLSVPPIEYKPGDSERSGRPDGMAPRPRPDGKSRDSAQPSPYGQQRESVAQRNNPRGQPRDSMAPGSNPHRLPGESAAPRLHPDGKPRESLKPSGKASMPLPPKGTDDKRNQKPNKKKNPPKKDSGNETGHPDAH
jgi:hypothetical protein